MNSSRDLVVDVFKGFTILWIIHIHTVFWSGDLYVSNWVRQFSLFIDVPIFFFISGYLIFTGPASTVVKRAIRQAKRLYIRYLILTFVVLLSIFAARYISGATLPEFAGQVLDILRVRVHFPEFRGFQWNLWFLETYLILILMVPLFSVFSGNLFYNVLILGFFFLVFATLSLEYPGSGTRVVVQVTFYAIFFFLGSTFRIIEANVKRREILISFLSVFLLSSMVYSLDGYDVILQEHKFPPSMPYMFYSLLYIHVFILIKCFYSEYILRIPVMLKKLFQWSSREIFNIYLVQSLVCSIPFYFVPFLKDRIPDILLYFIILFFNFSLTLFIVWLFEYSLLFYQHLKKWNFRPSWDY